MIRALTISAAMWVGLIYAIRRGGWPTAIAVALFLALGFVLFAEPTDNDDLAPKLVSTDEAK